MAIQNGDELAQLQALLRQQPAGGSAFAPVRRYRAANNAALAQQQQGSLQAFLLPYQTRVLEAQAQGDTAKAQQASLELKALQAQLAGQNDVAAGLGMTGGQLQAKLGMADPISRSQENMARASLASAQARSVAFEVEQANKSPAERMDEAMQAIGYGPGEFTEMMRLNKIGANADKAQQFDVQSSVDSLLGSIEGSARQFAGKPDLELFTMQDRQDGLALLQDRLSKGASQDEALQVVLQVAARRAQSRFMELTRDPPVQAEAPAAPAATNPLVKHPGTLMGVLESFPATPPRPRLGESGAQFGPGWLETFRGK